MRDFYQSKGRKEWIDFGKGISILLVVLFHIEQYVFRLNNGEIVIFDTGTSVILSFFRMPFFFFLSGYVFTSDYQQFSLSRKLRQLLRGIVWTYLLFSLLTDVPRDLIEGGSVADSLRSIFLGYEKWFVVALGVAQLMVALLLSRTKNLRTIGAFMLVAIGIGLGIKSVTGEMLPYQIDRAFFVVFYFLMGFFYRIYEKRFKRLINWRALILMVAVYASLMAVEMYVLGGTTRNVFWEEPINGFHMFMLYSLTGVAMMALLSQVIYSKRFNIICYLGSNSIVLFYLNGGVIKFYMALLRRLRPITYDAVENTITYIVVFLLVTITMFFIIRLIRRYCPIVLGDKKSFNHYFPICKW